MPKRNRPRPGVGPPASTIVIDRTFCSVSCADNQYRTLQNVRSLINVLPTVTACAVIVPSPHSRFRTVCELETTTAAASGVHPRRPITLPGFWETQ